MAIERCTDCRNAISWRLAFSQRIPVLWRLIFNSRMSAPWETHKLLIFFHFLANVVSFRQLNILIWKFYPFSSILIPCPFPPTPQMGLTWHEQCEPQSVLTSTYLEEEGRTEGELGEGCFYFLRGENYGFYKCGQGLFFRTWCYCVSTTLPWWIY